MCGIAGFLGFDTSYLEQALALLTHRGPDDRGRLASGPLEMGMTRLSVIDVGGSKQPIFNEDGSLALIFNGEIYNYQELHDRLGRAGHRLQTDGDTETIVHLYEEYGPACVHMLRGMFAFAIWDRPRQSLLLARDRLGIKPLYYSWDGQHLAFASEIKALRVCPSIGRAIDPVALEHYLGCQYVPGPRTMYAGIFKLQPGHYLHVRQGQCTVKQYWAPVIEPAVKDWSRHDMAGELYRLLSSAVRSHMVADVPLGGLLSGGIDSATIVGLMATYSSRRVQTFTVGFNSASGKAGAWADETEQARAVAHFFDTDHHHICVDASAASLLPGLMWHFDEPVADPAALPTYLLSRFARNSITVALSGEGADEFLGGYPRYAWATRAQRLQQRVPAPVGSMAYQALRLFVRDPDLRRRIGLIVTPMSPIQRHVAWTGGLTAPQRADLLAKRRVTELPHADHLGDGLCASDLMRADVATWLVDDVLMKSDKMSMAASLELRVPFLDHPLVEFVTSLPEALKQPAPQTKPLLREAMKPLLPPAALHARKRAFHVPVADWLRTDLASLALERLVSPPAASDHGLFDRSAVWRLWTAHRSGREDHAAILWSLLCFEIWYQEVFLQPLRSSPLARIEEAVA
jgi:asparagine synthase (glutamine-hydrolysing)